MTPVGAPEEGRVSVLPEFSLDPWPPFDLPAHVDPASYGRLGLVFKEAASKMEQAHGRPGFEDHLANSASRIFRGTRYFLVGQRPEYIQAAAALRDAGTDERTEAYSRARVAFDAVIDELDADLVKQIQKWVLDVRAKLVENRKAVVARRAEKAAAARATLSEVVPTIRAAVELIEAERERFSGAMRSLAKVQANIGRFDLLDGARGFNEAVDLLRRSLPPDLAEHAGSAEPVKRGPGRPRKSIEADANEGVAA